jgi:putative ABC transport system permease protein
MLAIIVPAAVLLVVYGGLALIAWRRPLFGRLAWREAVRRPAHSTLLVAGMMFGTAAILGMQGIGDSLQKSIVSNITTAWGRTDITVSQRGEPFSAGIATALAVDPRVAAGAAGVQGGFVLFGSVADLDRQLSASPVQISSYQPAGGALGTFELRDGRTTDGSLLAGDETILSSLLAGTLEAQVGDRVQVSATVGNRSQVLSFHVAGIARPGVVSGLGQRPLIFAPLAALQAAFGESSINIVRISAKGNGQQELDHAHALAPAVRALLAATPAQASLDVSEVKAQDLTTADKQFGPTRAIFIALSFFVVLAASALVVNLSLALAEERRPRLAVLRALGLTRTGLVTVAALEGAIYSLAAAVVGLLPGAAYTYFVASRPTPTGIGGATETVSGTGVRFFTVLPESIALSICLGALITLATIVIVSIRTSRMAISSAIRDLPEPASSRRRSWLRLAWPVILAGAGVAAWLQGDPALRAAGGAALIVAVSMLSSGRLSERVRATLTGAALVAWEVVSVLTAPVEIFVQSGAIVLGTVATGIAVFGAALAISANLRLVEHGINPASARLVATLRPPLAYLTRRPVRAGLATGSFALVLASLAFYAVLIPSLSPDARTIANGYDVRARAVGVPSFTIPESLQSQVASTVSVTTLPYVGPVNLEIAGSAPAGWQTEFDELYQLTDQQLANPPLVLSTRDPRYASDAAAWLAIRDDPSLVMTTSANLGHVSFGGSGGAVRLHVIGVVGGLILGDQGQGAGSYIGSTNTFARLGGRGAGTTLLIKTANGVNVASFARALRIATFNQGVDVVTQSELISINNQWTAWFSGVFTLLFKSAVVVGVLSFGILALRAAIERRKTIGVLRAVGYRPRQVLGGLLTEALVTTTVGVAAGIGIGFAIAWAYITASGIAQPQVDMAQVLVPTLLIYAAVLLVTIGPALQASRMRTSEALRIVG